MDTKTMTETKPGCWVKSVPPNTPIEFDSGVGLSLPTVAIETIEWWWYISYAICKIDLINRIVALEVFSHFLADVHPIVFIEQVKREHSSQNVSLYCYYHLEEWEVSMFKQQELIK